MTDPLALDFVRETMKDFGAPEQVRRNRIRLMTEPVRVREAIKAVQELLGCDRLVTMSTADNGTTFEILYHLTGPHRSVISVCTEIPRERPEIETTSDILLPAGIYERQIHDLFGIVFLGNKDLKRIILNEEWPENEYPLRKDWKPGPETYYGGIEMERK
jgi:NADH:ubiquinone oxidoreductase subunit C